MSPGEGLLVICSFIFSFWRNLHTVLHSGCCFSVTQLCRLSNPMDCRSPGLPVLHQNVLKLMAIESVIQSNHLNFCHPFLLLPSIFPSIRVFSNWVRCFHQVAKVLELQLQQQPFQSIFRVDFLYDWLVWSPCCPRDSQEFSPGPQFESINYLVLSLLYRPILTSVHDYWKNHSFDYMYLCQQRDFSAL